MKRPTIVDAVLENARSSPEIRLSAPQLAEQLGCKLSTIQETMSRLRARGEIPESDRQPARQPLATNGDSHRVTGGTSPEKLLQVLQTGKVFHHDERMRLLSHLARRDDAVGLGAVKLMHDVDPPPEAEHRGPGVPLTREEKVERMARLLEAVEDLDAVIVPALVTAGYGLEAIVRACARAGYVAPPAAEDDAAAEPSAV